MNNISFGTLCELGIWKNAYNINEAVCNSSKYGIWENGKRVFSIPRRKEMFVDAMNKINLKSGDVDVFLRTEEKEGYKNNYINMKIVDSDERELASTTIGLHPANFGDVNSFEQLAIDMPCFDENGKIIKDREEAGRYLYKKTLDMYA